MKHQSSAACTARLISRFVAFFPAAFSPAVLLSACGGEPLSLGTNDAAIASIACGSDVSGDVVLQTQEEVDALAGCEVIGRDLTIAGQGSLDLGPLSALRVVRGILVLQGLDSLAGLEGLERVSGLAMQDCSVADLEPLANLTSVNAVPSALRLDDPDLRPASGFVSIAICNALTDLSGLDGVADWNELALISNEGLTSLDGLSGPPKVTQVQVAFSPALTDLSALSTVVEALAFTITGTGIQSLGDLQLERAEAVALRANPALTDLDELAQLESAQTLIIEDNDSLVRIDMPILDEVHLISITGNAVLPAVPAYNAGGNKAFTVASGIEGRETTFTFTHLAFQVADNDQLTQVATPRYFANVQQVAIFRNPQLTQLDLISLERVDGLLLAENPELVTVSAPELERVGDLVILNNPELSVAPFAEVLTFTSEVTGNLDSL